MCEATGNSRNGYRDRRLKTCVGGPQPARAQAQDRQLLPGGHHRALPGGGRPDARPGGDRDARDGHEHAQGPEDSREDGGVSRLSKNQGQLLIVDVH